MANIKIHTILFKEIKNKSLKT